MGGVGRGWKPNIWGGVLFTGFYANLKFREILVQLYVMHAKYYFLLVVWVVLIYYMWWGRVFLSGIYVRGFTFFVRVTNRVIGWGAMHVDPKRVHVFKIL